MKREPVAKVDKRNKTMTSRKKILNFIYDQFEPIKKPDSRHRAYKTDVFINSNLLSYKN